MTMFFAGSSSRQKIYRTISIPQCRIRARTRTHPMTHDPKRREVYGRRVGQVGETTAVLEMLRLIGETYSQSQPVGRDLRCLARGANVEHVKFHLDEVVEVKPLEHGLLVCTKLAEAWVWISVSVDRREISATATRNPLGSPGNHRWRCLSYCVYRSLTIDQAKSFGRVDNDRRYLIHMRYVEAELVSAEHTYDITHLMLQALCMSP